MSRHIADRKSVSVLQSPLFYVGVAISIVSFFSGVLLLFLLPIGLALIGIDFGIRRAVGNRWMLYLIQSFFIAAIAFGGYFLFRADEMTITIKAPSGFDGKIGIVFGVDGYPEIQNHDTVHLPEALGLVVTSTRIGPNTTVRLIVWIGENMETGALVRDGNDRCGSINYRLFDFRDPSRLPLYPIDPSDPEDQFIDSLLLGCRDALN